MSSNAAKIDFTAIPQVSAKHVRVTDDQGHVDQEDVDISISAGEQVTWSADTKTVIVFNKPEGSPFSDKTFQVPAGGSIASGPARQDAEKKKYKYTVVGQGGSNDPGVIIQR